MSIDKLVVYSETYLGVIKNDPVFPVTLKFVLFLL